MFKVGDQLEVRVEKLSFGGAGIARYEGIVIFVPLSAPGDHLQVKITEVKKSFAQAEISKIITPSTQRTTPPCPHFGVCGGCNWQHLNYADQVNAKKSILNEILKKQVKSIEIKVDRFVESPKDLHYRNRIQIRAKDGQVGFFARNSHQFIPIQNCLLIEKDLLDGLKTIQKESQGSKELKKYNLKSLPNQKIHISLAEEDDEPIGFSQVNNDQNSNLVNQVLEWYKLEQCPQVIDLYGGSGNFALPLENLKLAKSLECVEANSDAIEQGRKKVSSLSPLRFIRSNVEDYLRLLPPLADSFVILDPPRVGCSETTMRYLAHLAPQELVYISCNPTTFARDLELFLKISRENGHSYKSDALIGYDMFPQTDHIELACRLLR